MIIALFICSLLITQGFSTDDTKNFKSLALEKKDEDLTDVQKKDDYEYKKVQSKKRPWLLKPSISRGVTNLVLRSREAITDPVRYQPNTPVSAGLTVGYKNYSIGYGVARGLSDRQIRQRGKTEYTNYQFQYVKNKVGIDLFYQDFKGFYVAENALSPSFILQTVFNYSDETSEQFPEMRQVGFGGNFYYFFNPQSFQYDAIFNQNKIPEGRGGTWVAMTSANQFTITNNGSLVPDSRSSDFDENSSISSAKIKTLGGLFGYGYQLVWKKNYYVGSMLLLGIGLGNQTLTNASIKSSYTGALRGYLKISAGYNTGRYFLTGLFQYDHTAVLNKDISLEPALYVMELNFGYRFKKL